MAAALVETGFAISLLVYVMVVVTFLLQVRVVYSVTKRLRLGLTVFFGAVCLGITVLFATAFCDVYEACSREQTRSQWS